MDATRYRLREFLDKDFAARADISHRLNPKRKQTEQEFRHLDALHRAPLMVYRVFVVEEQATGSAVGFRVVATDPEIIDPSRLWAEVEVDSNHQHRGIGQYLAEAMAGEARNRGALVLWAGVRVDRPRDLAFAERRGFRKVRRRWDSWLELPAPGFSSIPDRTDALAREGVEFTTLANEGPDREEVRKRLLLLFNEAVADEPRIGTYTPATYAQFVSTYFEGPGFLAEGFFLARQGERYIGVSKLELLPGEPKVLYQTFTGTLREFRGRGIATELKRRTVAYAQEHAFRAIRTSNDSLNYPMWAINAKLGYRRKVERVQLEKPVPAPGP